MKKFKLFGKALQRKKNKEYCKRLQQMIDSMSKEDIQLALHEATKNFFCGGYAVMDMKTKEVVEVVGIEPT